MPITLPEARAAFACADRVAKFTRGDTSQITWAALACIDALNGHQDFDAAECERDLLDAIEGHADEWLFWRAMEIAAAEAIPTAAGATVPPLAA